MPALRAAVLGCLLLAFPAAAQEASEADHQGPIPLGIGFAQAEEGTWLCRHEDPAEALSCAQELCREQVLDGECRPTAWCRPARWSGFMTMLLADLRATQIVCGAPSEAALSGALAAICAANEAATACDLVRTVDPDGFEHDGAGVSFAGGAAPAPADGEAQPEEAQP